ncbi:MAG TPA: hypothetical protein VK474_09865 [Chthoniobacterales bacterium]|nr:hypothetical protein [Chthoniobacterales bacterium]
MKLRLCVLFVASVAYSEARAQDFLDRLEQKLSLSTSDDRLRLRLSGTLDAEFYAFDLPAPGLIDATSETVFNPRLTLFLDAQLGPAIYFFSQARFDRHFDPTDLGAQARLDEYALRITPWEDGRLNIQIGKFATVIGRWVQRHLSWDNPFLNGPLVYENITAVEDRLAPAFTADFDPELADEKYEYNPVIWGPSYTSGASVAGRLGQFEYAFELKNAALSSRPESWDATRVGFDHPTVSGRLGFRPGEAWNFGLSGSSGPYFEEQAAPSLPPGRSVGDYREHFIAQDASWEWHHWQIWAEFHEARFEVPLVGNADVFGYFLEAKYKFTPQFFGAVRWNQQLFGTVPDGSGGRIPWGHDAWRIDAAASYRFTPHTQVKLQYDLEHDDNARHGFGHLFGAQLTVRF